MNIFCCRCVFVDVDVCIYNSVQKKIKDKYSTDYAISKCEKIRVIHKRILHTKFNYRKLNEKKVFKARADVNG